MEKWLPVVGYEDRYEVSDQGNVRVSGIGKNQSPKMLGRILSSAPNPHGYVHLTLSKDGIKKTHDVHRLVTSAFLGACPDNMTVNHKNGIKPDNKLENLEYVTRSENQRHALDVLGFQPRYGNNHPHVKLSDAQVELARKLHGIGLTARTLSEVFDYSHGGMCDILNGKARVKAA